MLKLFIFGLVAAISCDAGKSGDSKLFRIPAGLQPTNYKLKILTDLSKDFDFIGEVWIDVIANSKMEEIILNSKNLNIFENETTIQEITTKKKREVRAHSLRRMSMRERKRFNEPSPAGRSETTQEQKDKEPEQPKIESTTAVLQESPKPEEVSTTSTTTTTSSAIPNEELKTSTEAEISPPSSSSSSTTTTAAATPSTSAMPLSTSTTSAMPLSTSTTSAMPLSTSTTTTMPLSTSSTTSSSAESSETNSVEVSSETASTVASTTENVEELKITGHDFDTERQFVTLQASRSLEQGKKYRIHMKYQGFLSDNLVGFYRVAYGKRSKRTSWLAATVFEPLGARSAFPCFDEPEYKATFDIILGHSSEYSALSNSPLKKTDLIENKPGWQWDYFETTPPMSTYLVAFLISDLESLDTKEVARNATQFRYWARHEVVHKARYASKVVPNMKQYLEKELDCPDIMPKYDFVAVPSFISSALENWGLISTSEKALLFTPGFTSILNKYETTRLLAHELSHSWFGNSLTPRWWNEIWLSEGLCNFFEAKAADHVQPQWDVITFSTVASYLRVFSLDALQTTHPIVFDINSLNDVNEIFDSITYQKGYYLMRMLNHTFGEEVFMKGIRNYVKNHRLGVVEGKDLWKSLNAASHEAKTLPEDLDLNDVMKPWTTEPGYPVVQVTRNYTSGSAVITQKRFLRPKEDYEFRTRNSSETQWYIPLTYTTKEEMGFSDTTPKLWLRPGQEQVEIENIAQEQDFVLMNIQAAGLYRVNYDYDNWALLVDHLLSENYTDIAVINRVQILDDLLDFARAGEISYQQALDATSYLRQESHFLPWKAALSNFEYLSRMLRSTDTSRVFKKFMRNLVSARYDELGFETKKNETLFESMNRKQIVKWACRTGHRSCTRKSVNLFKKWTEEKKPDDHNPIPSNLRSVVYCTAIEQGGARDWQFLWQRYLSNSMVTDKAAIIAGLGCSRNVRTLRKYLDWSLKESSGLKKQDGVAVFKAVASNDVGFALAKSFLKERLGDMTRYVGNGGQHLPQMVDALARKMNQIKDLEDLEVMEQENSSTLKSVPRAVSQAMEKVKFNIGWVQKNFAPITEWLKRKTNTM